MEPGNHESRESNSPQVCCVWPWNTGSFEKSIMTVIYFRMGLYIYINFKRMGLTYSLEPFTRDIYVLYLTEIGSGVSGFITYRHFDGQIIDQRDTKIFL